VPVPRPAAAGVGKARRAPRRFTVRAALAALWLLTLPALPSVFAAGPGAAIDVTAIRLPPLRDPFLAAGASPPTCAEIVPAEREKFRCPASGLGQSFDLEQLKLPPLLARTEWPACGVLPAAEREKFGHPPICPTEAKPEPKPEPKPDPGPRPLPRADIPDLPRRVLSLPGGQLHDAPGGGKIGSPLPAFTIFYVYGEDKGTAGSWLRVGKDAFGKTDGWLAAESAEEWRTMLVMQYAPPGKRRRVLFFKRRNELIEFVRDDFFKDEARLAYESIESGGYHDDFFIAIEPAVGVDPGQAYLMPILDSHRAAFADGTPAMLLEVAGLNVDAAAVAQDDVRDTDNFEVSRQQRELRDFRIGVTFVIDTTTSMGPYIDETRTTVEQIYSAFKEKGLLGKVSFGLVGFRDDIRDNPRAHKYVTQVFQKLDPRADPALLLRTFAEMEPDRVSNQGFTEDAFAGLEVALNALDWKPFPAKLVVLITDAAARGGNDPLAANPGYDVLNVIENAERRDVAIFVVHLLTPEAARAGNIEPAKEQYLAITGTGDPTVDKYIGIDAGSVAGFKAQLEDFASRLTEAVANLSRGKLVKPEDPDVSGGGGGKGKKAPDLGAALINELFRAQLEYLGSRKGTQAPRFYRAWAADKDLTEPSYSSLIVKAFLTRNQLSALQQGVDQILTAFRRQETSGKDFFEALQDIAAQTSVEGKRRTGDAAPADLLPSFLKALPYRSEVLRLTQDQWRTFGPSKQSEFSNTLKSKLKAYQEIAADRDNWKDLGAGDRGLDVYPIDLNLFP
jgi:serine/threonine-protein kinase PpkA